MAGLMGLWVVLMVSRDWVRTAQVTTSAGSRISTLLTVRRPKRPKSVATARGLTNLSGLARMKVVRRWAWASRTRRRVVALASCSALSLAILSSYWASSLAKEISAWARLAKMVLASSRVVVRVSASRVGMAFLLVLGLPGVTRRASG